MANYNSIAEFNQALANAKTLLPAMMLPLVNTSENKMCREIRARVSVTGEKSVGGIFSPYSEGHKYKKKKYGNSALGKKVDKKNFYFSGAMWGSFGVRRIQLQNDSIVSTIDFTGQSGYMPTAELNEIHSTREDIGIGYPNKEEEAMLVAEIEKALFESLSKVL